MRSSPPCCLIAEDEALIGMALEAYLEDSGFEVAGPFGKAADAIAWLGVGTPDMALVDIVLLDGPCLPLIRVLRSRRVPFAIYSALRPPGEMVPELCDVPWLEKPASRETVAQVLRRVGAGEAVNGNDDGGRPSSRL